MRREAMQGALISLSLILGIPVLRSLSAEAMERVIREARMTYADGNRDPGPDRETGRRYSHSADYPRTDPVIPGLLEIPSWRKKGHPGAT